MHAHPVTIQHDALVSEAANLLERLSVRHLPVLDGTRLVAMVSDRDFRDLLGEWSDDEARARYARQAVSSITSATTVGMNAGMHVLIAGDASKLGHRSGGQGVHSISETLSLKRPS